MRLLTNGPADGNGSAAPPKAAETVAAGKSEREILLERHNQRLVKISRNLSASKKQAEEKAALLMRENEQLKQCEQKTAASQKTSWMGFGNA